VRFKFLETSSGDLSEYFPLSDEYACASCSIPEVFIALAIAEARFVLLTE
jgi:predicted acylesterase/phospholipase RssA